MSKFIHLHVHSHYSPQDGAQSTDMIAQKAAKLGMNAVALTDHGRCGGLLQFKKSCEEHKVKPIYGLEAYVAPKERTLRERLDDYKKTSYHLTLLAKNEAGLRNLFRLSSIGWLEGFYYKPRIDIESLRRHLEGLVTLSGCGMGFVSQMLIEGRTDRAVEHLEVLQDIFRDDLYIEVQNHGLDWQDPLKKLLFRLAADLDIPIVATQDSHYSSIEDADMHRTVCKLAAGDLTFEGDQSYFKSYDEMKEMFDEDEWHALDRTQEVADKCNCEWEYGKTIWPVFPIEGDKTAAEFLKEKVYEGFNRRFDAPTEEYRQRVEYELGVIEKMGFPTYFLVVADFINWAKAQGIPVGPGRGSAAGSLVAYCLGITEIDPIKYGLYFERFLNPDRVSHPDVDSDFCKKRRDEVVQYIVDKYGQDRCAQIGVYHKFKPRGTLRSFARVLGHPLSVGDELSALVPPNIAGKPLTFAEVIEAEPKILRTQYNDVVQLARRAEKLIRMSGVHAAGIVISDKDISLDVPLFRGGHGEVASQFDMHDCEDIGLVKHDCLGLKNLTVIHDTVQLVKKGYDKEIDINKIDYEDPFVFQEIFHKGRLNGIFQFETSSGFKDLCMQVKPDSIKDLSDVTSLFRPGPLSTGLTQQYADGRSGGKAKYYIPQLEPILKETYGVIVYQEQVMQMCIDLAGYTAPEADNVRRIIGKKKRKEMETEQLKFTEGCKANGISESKATQLFDDIQGFALYSFNKTVDKDTMVHIVGGDKRIKDCNPGDLTYSIDNNGRLIQTKIRALHNHGVVDIWEIEFDDKTIERCTLNHKWHTSDGQIPLWEIIEQDKPVWGTIPNPQRATQSYRCMRRMPQSLGHTTGQGREPYSVDMCRVQDSLRLKTASDKTSSPVPKLPANGEVGSIGSTEENGQVRVQQFHDSEGAVGTLPEMPEMPKDTQNYPPTDLPLNRPHSGKTKDILRNRKEDIAQTGNNKTKIRATCTVAHGEPRTSCFKYQESPASTKEGGSLGLQTRGIPRATLSKAWFHKERAASLRRKAKTSRLCKQDSKDRNRGRRPMAFLPGRRKRRKASGKNGKRQNVRFRNTTTWMETASDINRILQHQVRVPKNNLTRGTAKNSKRRRLGRDLVPRKVLRATYIGQCQGYDLEIDHPSHNYILQSGLCCSNSHGMAYSIISYQTAWLKAYYPREFACALLNSALNDQEDMVKYIYMCRDNEIPVLPPDVNVSHTEFTLDNGTIIFGLAGVKGFGRKASGDLLSRRPEGGFKSLEEMVHLGARKNHIKALAMCGALEEITELSREQLVEHIDELVEFYKKNYKYQERLKRIEESVKAVELWEKAPDGPRPRKAPKVNEKHIPVMPEIGEASTLTKADRLRFERQTLGFYLTGHPMDDYPWASQQAKYTAQALKEGKVRDGEAIKIPVVVASISKRRTKAKRDMALLMIEDRTGRMEATVFPKQWNRLKDIVEEGAVTSIWGTIRTIRLDDESPPLVRIIVNSAALIEGEERMTPVKVTLNDGTEVEFSPKDGQNYSLWQQAVACASNMQRMG